MPGEKSMTLAATSTAIDALLKHKEFRLLSAPLMRHVVSTSTLSDGAKVLWFSLWELCALETERKRKLTLGFLAKRLGKSVDSVRRYVNQLQGNGYLVVDEQYDVNQRQLPSIYRATAPAQVVALITKEIPDRKGRRLNQTSESKSSDVAIGDRHVDGFTIGNPIQVNAVDVCKNNNCEQTDLLHGDDVKVSGSAVIRPCVDVASTTVEEKSDLSARDCKLAQRLNAIRSRVRHPHISQKQAVSKSEVNGYKHEVQNRVVTPLDSEVCAHGSKAEEGGKSALDRDSRFASQESIPKEDNNITTSEPGGLRFWIYRQIKERKAFSSDPWRYVDEIAVAIEKGSLAKFNLAKAINIALKLIREGRWTAPRFVV
ncbi:hypothetical protein GCM10009425_47550 [Pseudomonas asuensis]|uniref:Helix-turn-helix domain-containing protein n=2 Tax=Pseudomonas asuensis TaxID=1825787 RepID=A0ABQ2H4D3_9PSED|nr:hypothetical protein GCM10009425_47550 [Pseudomonas asuensis]